MNIAKNLERSALYFPNRPAISEGTVVTPYARLNNAANRIATGLLKTGIQPGDHVGLCIPNSTGWMAVYFGILKTGGVAVTLSSFLTREELAGMLRATSPKALFIPPEREDEVRTLMGSEIPKMRLWNGTAPDIKRLMERGRSTFRALERDRDDTAAILFTGGTTGEPKGVMLTHENILSALQCVVFNERSTEQDRALCFLPFNHVFGQMHIMNAALLSGGCVELIPAFDMERVLKILSLGQVTKLFAVPTIYIRLLNLDGLKGKLGAVRYCFSAAASMAAETVRQWKERTGLQIHEAYGMTESASMVTYNHLHRHVVGSVGTVTGTTEVQIRDLEGNIRKTGEDGEICIRGRNIMMGYYNKPEETRRSFWGEWFRSGDIGTLDEEGYLYIVDRLKDMIITGGENVYPREIEEMLFQRPEVQECAVIGLPDPEWGERVTAVIVPKPGWTIDGVAIKACLKGRLSAFKVPKEYVVVEEFPKSSTGKILKRELKKHLPLLERRKDQ